MWSCFCCCCCGRVLFVVATARVMVVVDVPANAAAQVTADILQRLWCAMDARIQTSDTAVTTRSLDFET